MEDLYQLFDDIMAKNEIVSVGGIIEGRTFNGRIVKRNGSILHVIRNPGSENEYPIMINLLAISYVVPERVGLTTYIHC